LNPPSPPNLGRAATFSRLPLLAHVASRFGLLGLNVSARACLGDLIPSTILAWTARGSTATSASTIRPVRGRSSAVDASCGAQRIDGSCTWVTKASKFSSVARVCVTSLCRGDGPHVSPVISAPRTAGGWRYARSERCWTPRDLIERLLGGLGSRVPMREPLFPRCAMLLRKGSGPARLSSFVERRVPARWTRPPAGRQRPGELPVRFPYLVQRSCLPSGHGAARSGARSPGERALDPIQLRRPTRRELSEARRGCGARRLQRTRRWCPPRTRRAGTATSVAMVAGRA